MNFIASKCIKRAIYSKHFVWRDCMHLSRSAENAIYNILVLKTAKRQLKERRFRRNSSTRKQKRWNHKKWLGAMTLYGTDWQRYYSVFIHYIRTNGTSKFVTMRNQTKYSPNYSRTHTAYALRAGGREREKERWQELMALNVTRV